MSSGLDDLIQRVASDGVKAVVFDVMGTMLLCPPESDVFRLTAKRAGIDARRFAVMRTAAEREARNCSMSQYGRITLEEIYSQMEQCFSLSHEEAERLKEIELDAMGRLLCQRTSVKRLFDAALSAGKEIVAVEDTPLQKDLVEKALEENGFSGYTKLFDPYGQRGIMGTGRILEGIPNRLFKVLAKDFLEEGIKPHEVLYIGSNANSVHVAHYVAGFEVTYLPSADSVFRSFSASHRAMPEGSDDVLLWDAFATRSTTGVPLSTGSWKTWVFSSRPLCSPPRSV